MIIVLTAIITIILIIFFNSDALVEYGRLIKHISKLLLIDKFDKAYANDFDLTYVFYLRRYHNCFFIRLITCPICVSFWLSLVGCCFGDGLIDLPIIYILSLFAYYSFVKLHK